MGRGTELAEGVTIDEGKTAGVRSLLHFQGDQLIVQKSQENIAEVLEHVKEMRERNEGKGWGEGKEVGHVLEIHRPELEALRNDPLKRRRWLKSYFKERPMLCAYPAFLK